MMPGGYQWCQGGINDARGVSMMPRGYQWCQGVSMMPGGINDALRRVNGLRRLRGRNEGTRRCLCWFNTHAHQQWWRQQNKIMCRRGGGGGGMGDDGIIYLQLINVCRDYISRRLICRKMKFCWRKFWIILRNILIYLPFNNITKTVNNITIPIHDLYDNLRE